MEVIKHAAVKTKEGWPIFGKCHAECFGKGHFVGIEMSERAEDQGFITSTGRFVNRTEAATLAKKAGQIKNETKILFSEDLWCPTYFSINRYDEISGYEKK